MRASTSPNSSRHSSIRGWRARTQTGVSTSSTILSSRSARPWCARGFRARSSTSIAIRAGPRFIPVRRRPNCARPRPSTASRSIGRAERRTRRRSASDGASTSIPTTPRSAARLRACAATFRRVALFDAHSIRSRDPASLRRRIAGVQSRDQFRARAAIPDCARRSARFSRRRVKAWSSTGASRAAGSRAPMASRSEGVEALQLELACRAYMREPERPAPTTGRRRSTKRAPGSTRATLKRVLETILASGRRLMEIGIVTPVTASGATRSGIQRTQPHTPAAVDPRSDLSSRRG